MGAAHIKAEKKEWIGIFTNLPTVGLLTQYLKFAPNRNDTQFVVLLIYCILLSLHQVKVCKRNYACVSMHMRHEIMPYTRIQIAG
jgi:hypothetical protein